MDVSCPRCSVSMLHHALGPMEAWTCRTCGGAYVSADVEAALESAKAASPKMQRVVRAVALKTVDVRPPVACPLCSFPMERRQLHGVSVDSCAQHGTWYDRGELRQLVSRLQGGAGAEVAAIGGAAGVAAALASQRPPQRTSAAGEGAEIGFEVVTEGVLDVADAADVGGTVLEAAGDALGFAAEVLGSILD